MICASPQNVCFSLNAVGVCFRLCGGTAVPGSPAASGLSPASLPASVVSPGSGEQRNARGRCKPRPTPCRLPPGSRSRPAPAGRKHRPGGRGDGRCDGRGRPAAFASPGRGGPAAALPRRRGGREHGTGAVRHHPLLRARRRRHGARAGERGRRAAGPGRSRLRSGPRPRRVRPGRGWWPRPELPGVCGDGGAPVPRCGRGVQWPGRGSGGLSVSRSVLPSSAL